MLGYGIAEINKYIKIQFADIIAKKPFWEGKKPCIQNWRYTSRLWGGKTGEGN